MESIVLLIQCPDRRGIVAEVTAFVHEHGGNITGSNQHSTDPEGGRFFMRLEFCVDAQPDRAALEAEFSPLARKLEMTWRMHYASDIPRMALAVSKFDHCLLDLLYRVKSGDLRVSVHCVVSNHETARELVESYGIPFHHLPVTPESKRDQERHMLELVRDNSDFFVLARYMQILSRDFLENYGKDVINIHHSFLPSFMGANPYRQAYDRGVKLIGATAHYATTELDEGPIIEQAVGRVTHRDSPASLRRKGRALEQQALAYAIAAHVERRIIKYENKTIVFD